MTPRSKSEPDVAQGAAPVRSRAAEDADVDAVAALWHACDLVVPYNVPADDVAVCRGWLIDEAPLSGHGDGRREQP